MPPLATLFRALLVVLAVVLSPATASAASPSPDAKTVLAYLNDDGLRILKTKLARSTDPAAAALRTVDQVTDLRPLWRFSESYLTTGAGDPVTRSTEWISLLRSGRSVLGTLRVSTPKPGRYEIGSWTADRATATAIGKLGAEYLVLIGGGGLVAVDDATATGIDPAGARLVPPRTPLVDAVVALRAEGALSTSTAGTPNRSSSAASTTPPELTPSTIKAAPAEPETPVDLPVGVIVGIAAGLLLAGGLALIWWARAKDAQWDRVDTFERRGKRLE